MKVIHILYSGLGGVFDVVDSLIKTKNKKVQNGAIYIGPYLNNNYKKHQKILGKNFFFIKTFKRLSFFYFINIFVLLIKFKPNIIVLHNYQFIPCLFIKIFFGTKLIYVDHKPYSTKSYKDNLVILLSKYFTNIFVVLNKDNKSYLKKKHLIQNKKIHIIENGIEIKKIKNNLKKKFIIIGMAGRMNSSKLHFLIIDAVQSLLENKYKIMCHFPGQGEEMKNLKNIILKKFKKNFVFNGFLNHEKLEKWFLTLSLYIQASKGEGSSISILKALSLKIPTIASNVSGIKDLKVPYLKSMLFDNNKKSLKKKILNYLKLEQKKKLKLLMDSIII